jgi:SAM-dependent methyltransferase
VIGGLIRRLRWRASRWSADDDREFHDALFSPQQYDPFTFAYPGYVTIRRFADLASAHLAGVRRAADLGCGPGEITCELARRHPGIAFQGIDHSGAAIERARGHAARLQLTNVTFETGDIARTRPDADLVLMFDAFHHLLDPSAFVRASGVDRFLLVEPAGTWLGGWKRTLDLDWLAAALDDIRARLLWEAGEPAPPETAAAAGAEAGTAVEHRYPIDDFQRFFAGFGLDVRGTAAGFDRYPPDPYGRPPLREAFGRATYDALVTIEEALFARNLDLHAKHWVIYAERGAPDRLRRSRARARRRRSRDRTTSSTCRWTRPPRPSPAPRSPARWRCATAAGGRSRRRFSRAITGWTAKAPSPCRTARARRCRARSLPASRAR